jgi:hypothetical protein
VADDLALDSKYVVPASEPGPITPSVYCSRGIYPRCPTATARSMGPGVRRDDSIRFYLLPKSEITPLATSLFQMNSTTSAPMVAMMKPAP